MDIIKLQQFRESQPLYNSWRAKVYTQKGKNIGFPEKWKTFEGFCDDVGDSYQKGYILTRYDQTKPYSKENCFWAPKGCEARPKITLEYNGRTQTLLEWADELNASFKAMKTRYYRGWTPKEVLFGKEKTVKSVNRNSKTPKNYTNNTIRCKASKMISSYKHSDKVKGLPMCDITIDWMIDNIITKPCVYCGDTSRVGCDRINNDLGHTKDNVVPCCFECNCARNNNFSYDEMLEIGKTIRRIKNERNNSKKV